MQNAILVVKGVDGESKRADKGMEVLSFAWSLRQPATMHDGNKGGTSQRADVDNLSFTKLTDAATPKLIDRCNLGEHLDEAVLTLYKQSGKAMVPYLVCEMKGVIVETVAIGEEGGPAGQLVDHCRLNFALMTVKYKTQTETGAAGPESVAIIDTAPKTA